MAKVPSLLLYLILPASVGLLAAYLYVNRNTPKTAESEVSISISITPVITPTPIEISADLPPLYPGIEWKDNTRKEIRFRDSNNRFIELNGNSITSIEITEFPKSFLKYYKDNLTKLGWTETWMAGGEGDPAGGEHYGFQKSDKYIQFGVQQLSDKKYRALLDHN